MNERYTRITVPLSKEEFEALRNSAQADYRHPREQARFILRSTLLGRSIPKNSKSAVEVETTQTGAFAGA